MSCTRRNHLLLVYCLFLLAHVQQTVNSQQNGYRHHTTDSSATHHRYGHNPLRPRLQPAYDDAEVEEQQYPSQHPHRHQHNHRLQHQLHRTWSGAASGSSSGSGANSIRSGEMHRQQKNVPRYVSSKRIEEAVHAFQTSTTSHPGAAATTGIAGHHTHFQQHHQPQYHHQRHHHLQPHTPHQQSAPRWPSINDNSDLHKQPALPWILNHRQSTGVPTSTTTSPRVASSDARFPYMENRHRDHDSQLGFRYPEPPSVEDNEDDSDNTENGADDYEDDYYYYEEQSGHGNNGNAANDPSYGKDSSRHRVHDEDYHAENLAGEKNSDSKMFHDNNEMDYDYNVLADEPINESGSLTEQKWRNYSTRAGVEKMAEAENPEIAVRNHLKRMEQEGMCKFPHPKIFPIANNTSKRFLPSYTILHRCSDDTGCCGTPTKTCVASRTESVVLYFYVFPMRQTRGQTRSIIEPLTLTNHTECYCADRILRTTTPADVIEQNTDSQRHECVKYFDLDDTYPDDIRCDCLESNAERREICLRLSKGKEGFPVDDRKCVMQKRCLPPICEYGQYNRTMGRCPSKEDKVAAAKNINHLF